MRTTLERILADLKPLWRRRGERFTYRWQWSRQSYVEGMMARITTEERVTVTVVPKTAAGNTARIDGAVEWSTSDPAVATVTSTGPLTATVASVAPGVAQIFAVCDADLGDGVRPVEMSGALEVVEAEAVVGEIVFGAPELKP